MFISLYKPLIKFSLTKIFASLAFPQYHRYTFTTMKQQPGQGKNPNATVREKSQLRQLLDKYQNDSPKLGHTERVQFIGQLIRLSHKKAIPLNDSIEICNTVKQIINNYNNKSTEQILKDKSLQTSLISIINSICLAGFLRQLRKTEEKTDTIQQILNPQLLTTLLAISPGSQMRTKWKVIKFVNKFHSNNEEAKSQIRHLIRQTSQKDIEDVHHTAFFIWEVITFCRLTGWDINKLDSLLPDQFTQLALRYINNNIMLVEPKMLNILTKSLAILSHHQRLKKSIKTKTLLAAVNEHILGMNLLQSLNVNDAIYLIQTLSTILTMLKEKGQEGKEEEIAQVRDLAGKIYGMVKKIHASPEPAIETQDNQSKEQGESVQKIIGKQQLRLVDINILLDSMINLWMIDSELFLTLEQKFFKLIPTVDSSNIEFYVLARIRVAKAVISSLMSNNNEKSAEKARLIQQEHGKFILKLLQEMNSNTSLDVRDKLKILQTCQKLSVKSKKIKRIISEMCKKGDMSETELAFAEVVYDGY